MPDKDQGGRGGQGGSGGGKQGGGQGGSGGGKQGGGKEGGGRGGQGGGGGHGGGGGRCGGGSTRYLTRQGRGNNSSPSSASKQSASLLHEAALVGRTRGQFSAVGSGLPHQISLSFRLIGPFDK